MRESVRAEKIIKIAKKIGGNQQHHTIAGTIATAVANETTVSKYCNASAVHNEPDAVVSVAIFPCRLC